MPYPYRRRYTTRRRRPVRRRPATSSALSRGMSYARYAVLAYKMAQRLRRLVNVEVKKFDQTIAVGTNVTSGGTVYSCCDMAQGDTDQTRDGNSIKPLGCKFQLRLANNATAVNTAVRVMVIRDLQQVADTAPTVSDVLDTSIVGAYAAPLNNATVGRYKVLSDKLYSLNTVAKPQMDLMWYQKLNGHIRYNGSAASDIQKNGLYMLIVSDQATNYPTFGFNTRLHFTDN